MPPISRPRRVAVSPGAGESRIAAAAAAGCDVLVSGDISHHRVVEATDRGLSIVDVGHAASERPGMARLRRSLVAEICAGDAASSNSVVIGANDVVTATDGAEGDASVG